MAGTIIGRYAWSLGVDNDGFREYKLTNLIKCDVNDGPYIVWQTPGIPLPGAIWSYGNDVDPWAHCKRDSQVRRFGNYDNEPGNYWTIEQTFSTKGDTLCQNNTIENPLLQPDRISGGFINETREVANDLEGKAITNSAFEPIRGRQVEFEYNRPQVRIEQNVANLQLPLLCNMINTVNSIDMWGLPPRCIKLSNITWSREYYGQCLKYYKRTLEFDANFETFDRYVMDVGTKALHGKWVHLSSSPDDPDDWSLTPIKFKYFNETSGEYEIKNRRPNPLRPGDFVQLLDRQGHPTRYALNGKGVPAMTKAYYFDPLNPDKGYNPGPRDPGVIKIKYYRESNFFQLGVPPTF